MKLYDLDSCPFCELVRDKLEELNLSYEKIPVPSTRNLRTEVYEVSGQYLVPVLVDGETVLDDEEKIIQYLEKQYGKK
ncbi:MAG: glutathione S-transferase N-terminal domain-containing protein [Nitrospirae bacterium]|nr:glutathione S-transferase N-terminal domain-containing protein [Nitrospirota bacterium]MBI3593898.1 glutathione S-transferase N-terminal domain-containing protein [Nitrospirota bacterium]